MTMRVTVAETVTGRVQRKNSNSDSENFYDRVSGSDKNSGTDSESNSKL